MLHTIGDSHSRFGWDYVPNAKIHHLGPKLAFSIGRDGIDVSGYVTSGDTLVFSFGEIDCRCHVHKHATPANPYNEIINDIVIKYITAIHAAVSDNNIRVCVFNIPPPIQRHNTVETPEYPYLGTDEERKMYVLHFNAELRKVCASYNYLFIDVYDKYTDSNGFLDKALSDGIVHIKNGTYIKEFVEKYL